MRDNLCFIEEEYDQHEMKALIGRCDFFMGSRMHACIAAISQCVPALGFAYSRKFRGMFASIGMEELVADLCEHGENSALEIVDRVYQSRSVIRAKLEEEIPAVRASVLKLFNQFSI